MTMRTRRGFVAGLAVALAGTGLWFSLIGPAQAKGHDSDCQKGGTAIGPVTVNTNYKDSAGDGGLQVCHPGGTITTAGSQSKGTGFIVLSGAGSGLPSPFQGYIGVDSNDKGTIEVVGCSGGPGKNRGYNYKPNKKEKGTDHNVIVDSKGKGIPPGTGSGPCSS